jgi:hypothetical protein
LAPTVGQSPRRVKRFFNTYLLIQAIVSASADPDAEDADSGMRAAIAEVLSGCSVTQQSLALATSLALAMQDGESKLGAKTLAALTLKQIASYPTEVKNVLRAYLNARKPDSDFPDGLEMAFRLFLPITCRYGFRDIDLPQ